MKKNSMVNSYYFFKNNKKRIHAPRNEKLRENTTTEKNKLEKESNTRK